MKDTIDMAREAGLFTHKEVQAELKAFEALVRADEREACATWLEKDRDAPYWAELLRARGNT
jgi:hypothetical protein